MLVLHTYTHTEREQDTHTHTQKENSSGIPISNQCSTVKQTQQTCECSNGEGVVCLYWTNIESERQAIKPIQSHSFGGWQLKLSLFKLSLSKSHFSFFGRHPKSPVRTSSFTGVKKKKKKLFILNNVSLVFQTVSATATPTAAATSTTWTSSRVSAASTTPGVRTANTADWATSETPLLNWMMRASVSVSLRGDSESVCRAVVWDGAC